MEGTPGTPIVLTVHGPDGEVAVPLTPVRALELARDLTAPAVTTIKTSQGAGLAGIGRRCVAISGRVTPECHRKRDRAVASPERA